MNNKIYIGICILLTIYLIPNVFAETTLIYSQLNEDDQTAAWTNAAVPTGKACSMFNLSTKTISPISNIIFEININSNNMASGLCWATLRNATASSPAGAIIANSTIVNCADITSTDGNYHNITFTSGTIYANKTNISICYEKDFWGGATYASANLLLAGDGIQSYGTPSGISSPYAFKSRLWGDNGTVSTSGAIQVALLNPTNNTINNTNNWNFNYNATFTNANVTNCSLWLNNTGTWQLNRTNTSSIINGTNQFNNINIANDGTYKWNIECDQNNGSQYFYPSNFTFKVDSANPSISADNIRYNKSFAYDYLQGHLNFSDDNLYSYEFYLDSTLLSNLTNIPTAFYQYNYSINTTNISVGVHRVNTTVCDGHTAKSIQSYSISSGFLDNSLKYSFNKGWIKVYPETTNIITDSFTTNKGFDRYTMTYSSNNNINSKVFIIESDNYLDIVNKNQDKYKAGLVSPLLKKWVDLNIKGSTGKETYSVRRLNQNKVEVTIGNLNSKIIEFESIGDLNCNSETYQFYKFNYTVSYNTSSLGNIQRVYTLNLTRNSSFIQTAQANITLDGNSTDTSLTYYDDFIIFNKTSSKVYSAISTAVPFNFTYSLLGNQTKVNVTPTFTQTIYGITVNNCSVTYPYPILNISYYDEVDNTELTAENQFNLHIYDSVSDYNRSWAFGTLDIHSLCTSVAPNTTLTFAMDGLMKVSRIDYTTKYVTIATGDPFILSNVNPPVMNITLLSLGNATTVVYHIYSSDFSPLTGTLRILKCNIDGTKTLTQSVNIVSGTAVAQIILTTQPYAYEIVIGDTVYRSSDFYTCHPEVSTDITYYVSLGAGGLGNNIGLSLTPCNVTKTGNWTATMSWGDNPYDSSYVQGCLVAYRQGIYNLTKIYENCSTVEHSITRTIPDNGNDYYVYGELRQGDSVATCNTYATFISYKDTPAMMGLTGIFAIILLVASLALIYAGKGDGVMLGAGIGVVLAFIAGMFVIGWQTALSICLILATVAFVGRYSKSYP